MNKIINKLSFILVLSLFFTMINSVTAQAYVTITVTPTYAYTNVESMKIYIDKLC